MSEPHIFRVDVPIFNRSVVCAYACSREEGEALIYDYEGRRNKIRFGDDAIGSVATYLGDVFMWVEDPENKASVVFHELTHVAFAICEITGMAPNEELICYLAGWLKLEVADKMWDLLQAEKDAAEESDT